MSEHPANRSSGSPRTPADTVTIRCRENGPLVVEMPAEALTPGLKLQVTEVEIVCDRVQIIDRGNLVFHGSIEDLKQQRRGNKLLVGMKKPPTLKKLQALFDVVKLEKQDDLLHIIQFKSMDIDVEAFIKASIKEKWGLFQISPHITSLEDTFVQLTNQ